MRIFSVKNGINPSEVIELFRHIRDKCKNLELKGLMTIGRFGHDYTVGPNPDFECLVQCHTNVCQAFSLSPAEVQLSMGMSDDFEYAVSHPSSAALALNTFTSKCAIFCVPFVVREKM